MEKLKVLDLFSGIGGFSLGLERTGGFETVAFCEIEEFPRKVLKKHWPGVPCYHDVRTLTADVLKRDGISVDVITGGFPCQDISCAGKQAGIKDGTRSGLWSEIVRLIGELRPQYVIVENVANLLSGPSERRGGWFGRVLGDLAEHRYDAEWRNIPAWLAGLDQARERIWVVANRDKIGRNSTGQYFFPSDDLCAGLARNAAAPIKNGREVELRLRALTPTSLRAAADRSSSGGPHGLPSELDRIAGCGNAVVPQIPEMIGHAILEAHQ